MPGSGRIELSPPSPSGGSVWPIGRLRVVPGEQLRLQLEVVERGGAEVVPLRGLERLGETHEFGTLLLDLLEASGMVVGRYEAFGGGVGVTVEIGPLSLHASGKSLSEFASELFLEAMSLRCYLPAGSA